MARGHDPASPIFLHDIDQATYCRLRDNPTNDHVRMDYLDGTLRLRLSAPIQLEAANLLGWAMRGLAAGHDMATLGLRRTTLRAGLGQATVGAKECDYAFYIGPHVRAMRSFKSRGVDIFDATVETPIDLAIEVDGFTWSDYTLAIYARLGVREVWWYDVGGDEVRLHRLEHDRYRQSATSVVLPRMTSGRILRALAMYDEGEIDDLSYMRRLEAWARALPAAEA